MLLKSENKNYLVSWTFNNNLITHTHTELNVLLTTQVFNIVRVIISHDLNLRYILVDTHHQIKDMIVCGGVGVSVMRNSEAAQLHSVFNT